MAYQLHRCRDCNTVSAVPSGAWVDECKMVVGTPNNAFRKCGGVLRELPPGEVDGILTLNHVARPENVG